MHEQHSLSIAQQSLLNTRQWPSNAFGNAATTILSMADALLGRMLLERDEEIERLRHELRQRDEQIEAVRRAR